MNNTTYDSLSSHTYVYTSIQITLMACSAPPQLDIVTAVNFIPFLYRNRKSDT